MNTNDSENMETSDTPKKNNHLASLVESNVYGKDSEKSKNIALVDMLSIHGKSL